MFSNLYQKTTVSLLSLVLVGCLLLPSCNNFLDVESKHIAKEDQQWKTLEDTRAALMGVYGLMRAALAENNTHWVCGDLRGGDFTVTTRPDLQAVVDNNLNDHYPLLKEISNWRRFYATINAASIFIEKAPRVLENDKSYSELNLTYDIAQARALRAFAYFYMVRIWGDVPLITYSYDNGSFPKVEPTDASLVLTFAKDELKSALKVLPYELGAEANNYYGIKGSDWRGILFNKLSVYTILAHIAAWEGNYIDAEVYSAFILDNASKVEARYVDVDDLTGPQGLYSTASQWRGSRLVSFTFKFADSEATQSGHLEQLTLAAPIVPKTKPDMYISRDSLYSIFNELSDLRFGINPDNGGYSTSYVYDVEAKYPIFKKVNIIQDGSAVNNSYAVFGSALLFSRLEDITLLRAEALCAINRPEEGLIYLNVIRKARGLAEVSFKKDFGGDQVKVIQAVFSERRRELAGEGWRWYDRIRQHSLLNNDVKLDQLINDGTLYWTAK